MRTAPIFASLVLFAALAACDTNPTKNSPKATVSNPVAPAAAQPQDEGATTLTFSNDGSKIAFVGAKITAKHEGGFNKFTGTIKKAFVSVEIDTSSLFTDQAKLTGHLKGADFFDVEKFPTASFVSTQIKEGVSRGSLSTITGNLTLHGVTKSISFPASIHAIGNTFEADAEFGINRKDFGIAYAGKADDLIKDDVLIKLTIRAKK